MFRGSFNRTDLEEDPNKKIATPLPPWISSEVSGHPRPTSAPCQRTSDRPLSKETESLECLHFLGLRLLEDEDIKRWNAVFDNRLPAFRAFLLERYSWPFEDQHVATLVRVIRPHIKARFQREVSFMLDRFPTGPDLKIESIEQYTLLYMEPLLETLHEWYDARVGLADQVTPRINNASVMRACYAFREASEEQSKGA